MALNTLEPISALTHWLHTPIGSYCGYPTYGFNYYELEFKNSFDATISIDRIMNKIKVDLGDEVYNNIVKMEVVTHQDEYYLLVQLKETITGVHLYDI